MDLVGLKSATSPVSGTAASVGDGDNLKSSFSNSVNDAVRKPPEEEFPRTVQVHPPSLWTDGVTELGHESICGGGIALGISPVGGPCLRDGVRMNPNAWSGHRIARGFGGGPPTREPSLLFPALNDRCGVRSPYSTPPQRLRLWSRLDFQLAGRQARRAPQAVDEGPLLRLFWELTS
jgi:hypothetical protein